LYYDSYYAKLVHRPPRERHVAKVEELFALIDRFDAGDETVVTSVRQPRALRDALKTAVALGMAPTPNDVAVAAVAEHVRAFAQHLALDRHLAERPQLRPTLFELAMIAAELDDHPLQAEPDLLRRAAAALEQTMPDAIGADVLLYAEGMRDAARTHEATGA
jgi:hypothetical protein